MSEPRATLLVQCRAGFEGDCAAELAARAEDAGCHGSARAIPGSGFVRFESEPMLAPSWRELVFARELWPVHAELSDLPQADRTAPLVAALAGAPRAYCALSLEHPDTNEGKALANFLRRFAQPLRAALGRAGIVLDDPAAPCLHLFFTDSRHAFLGSADPTCTAPWPMGIPRLRFPRGAPSRSTLKLDEAFLALLTEDERARWLMPGMTAVDLGAAPGGWTWQLAHRGLRVTAVDNGPMDPALLESELVTQLREDGFRYRPPRRVDWLVCDMVEQPQRVAALVAEWLAAGDCRRAIFNLKLPMKQRHRSVSECLAAVRARVPRVALRAKQLYHDREEVTVYAG